ncbi:MAG: cytochrome c-type biogenesis protein CcmH [Sphingomonadaceae bacterium]|nr:cytochrome c-type biogenesis protein CcmH [Sphingomonadaceae bacterium]
MTRAFLLLWLVVAAPVAAVLPAEQLPDPRQEARARAISRGLRCVQCQNQSIDDSEAPIAHDLRVVVRERIAAGATDVQARDYIVQRYGSYVLLKPPVEAGTLLLWLGPAAFVAIGGIAAALTVTRRRTIEPTPLTPAEAARVDTLLDR